MGISLAALAAGSAHAQSNTNTSQYNQTGTGNNATIDNNIEGNSNNSATIIQNGTTNNALVVQRGTFNRSFMQQIGTSNQVGHRQTGNSNSADSRQNGDFNGSFITQVGNNNTGTAIQVGFYNTSTVRQGYAVDSTVPNGENRSANNNVASIDQSGAGLSSVVNQRAASVAGLAASDNTANVFQRSSGTSSTLQQISQITQESRGNYAELFQYEGSTAAPNSSTIVQRNSSAPGTNPVSSNAASVAQRGAGNQSQLTQDGFRNIAQVRTQGGGTASADGNRNVISQTGNDLAAQLTVGRSTAAAVGNSATITQTGNFNSAGIFQYGTRDQASVTQSDGLSAGTTSARALAGVYQNAAGDSATVQQAGDNFADITQAFGSASSVSVQQRDAGDQGSTRAFNSATVAQYGTNNRVTIGQDAVGAQATAWQKVGSGNNTADIAQGLGRTSLPSTTATPGFVAGPTGAGTINVTANVTQAGAFNDATVHQDGVSLTANVDQNGTGTANLRNIVFVSQTGTGNFARAYQGPGVGASAAGDPASGNSSAQNGGGAADEFYFGGGARSAELRILQTNSGNSASIEQYGRGQLARIEQSGANNSASIVQQAAATNATAIIRQTGSGNSYNVTQVSPGQYVVVTQTGNNNSANNVVTRP
ncbi:MAG TPA: hypothetical protein VF662_00050 [Allosphingosinicella sp.]